MPPVCISARNLIYIFQLVCIHKQTLLLRHSFLSRGDTRVGVPLNKKDDSQPSVATGIIMPLHLSRHWIVKRQKNKEGRSINYYNKEQSMKLLMWIQRGDILSEWCTLIIKYPVDPKLILSTYWVKNWLSTCECFYLWVSLMSLRECGISCSVTCDIIQSSRSWRLCLELNG